MLSAIHLLGEVKGINPGRSVVAGQLNSGEEGESDGESSDASQENKGLSTITIIIISVIVGLLCGGGAAAVVILATQDKSNPPPPLSISPPGSSSPPTSPTPPTRLTPSTPLPSLILFSPSPKPPPSPSPPHLLSPRPPSRPPPRPPLNPQPRSNPPPLNPCLSSGDAVRLVLDGSELVISNIQNKGPDFGQREQMRYANGAQVYSPDIGMFVFFDAVISYSTPWEVDDPSDSGKLFGNTNSIAHWKLRRGTSVSVDAELLPTCCQNLPTCSECDLINPDRATCYANGCCCKGEIITELDGCTADFKRQRNYSCVNMDQRSDGGTVLPDYVMVVFSFFNLAIGEYAERYNASYTRSPLRPASGSDITSRLARSGDRFTGTAGIPYSNAVVDSNALTDQQAENSVTTFKPPQGITRFKIGSDSQGPPGDYWHQVGGESLLCAPPPPPPPSPSPLPPSSPPNPPIPTQPTIILNALFLSCGEVVLQAKNLAELMTGGGLSTSARRSLYKYVGDDFLNSRTNTYSGTTWPHAFVPLGAQLGPTPDERIIVNIGDGSNLLVNG